MVSAPAAELWMAAPAAYARALPRLAVCCNADSAARRTVSTDDTIGNTPAVAIRSKAPATFLPRFVYRQIFCLPLAVSPALASGCRPLMAVVTVLNPMARGLVNRNTECSVR